MLTKFTSLLVLSLAVSPSTQVCAPDCTGVDPGTFVRDPTDCTRYHVCLDLSGNGDLTPSSEPVDCPSDEYFNDQHTVPRCDPIADAVGDFCTNLCNPCVPHCIEPGTLTPHPTDCSKYYVCLQNDLVLEESCPQPNVYFNFRTGLCQADATLCYDYCDICLPHCVSDGERVPDPYDCHRFYFCTPPTMSSFLCPGTDIFNRETQVCEPDAICIMDC